MFDRKHYVPLLRWKRAEWLALGSLQAKDKARMTPLVEIIPESVAPRKRRPRLDQMLEKNAVDLRQNWGVAPLFIDLWLLDSKLRGSNGTHPFLLLAREARARQIALIPVNGLHRDSEYQAAVASIVAKDKRGACVRVFQNEVADPAFRRDLERVLYNLTLSPNDVDLVVDCQRLNSAGLSYSALCARLPDLSKWRSFTVASGAFPQDLQGVTLGRNLLPRSDWLSWKKQAVIDSKLLRQPTFGDYTIQYGIYKEPPERCNFSASIRYTSEADWLVMRGEGVFHEGSPGFQQWPANAQLLSSYPEFCGPDFSNGDRYIEKMGAQTQKTGSAGTWLQAGINHHLTFVVRQIANLFGT